MSYVQSIIVVLFFFTNSACSKKLQLHNGEYFPKDNFPTMVYIEDEVQPLNTQTELPSEKQFFVEIRKKDGVRETGRLIRITETNLVLSKGFYYSTIEDSTLTKVESKIVIPKEDILILKVYGK